MRTDDFFIVTGGPGAGKTALIEALAAAGHRMMPEAGRAIIVARNAMRAPPADPQLFGELMLSWEIRSHGEAMAGHGSCFFDRGVPELAGYFRLMGLPVPAHVQRAAALWKYNPTVFIAPPWRDIFVNDAERRQDFEEAVRTHDFVADAYLRQGYRLEKLPLGPVSERVSFVLAKIAT
jgi:predicted ATPase